MNSNDETGTVVVSQPFKTWEGYQFQFLKSCVYQIDENTGEYLNIFETSFFEILKNTTSIVEDLLNKQED